MAVHVATLVSHAQFYSSPSPSTKYVPVIQTTILNFTVAKYLLLTQTQMILVFDPLLLYFLFSIRKPFALIHYFDLLIKKGSIVF